MRSELAIPRFLFRLYCMTKISCAWPRSCSTANSWQPTVVATDSYWIPCKTVFTRFAWANPLRPQDNVYVLFSWSMPGPLTQGAPGAQRERPDFQEMSEG